MEEDKSLSAPSGQNFWKKPNRVLTDILKAVQLRQECGMLNGKEFRNKVQDEGRKSKSGRSQTSSPEASGVVNLRSDI